MDPHAALLTRAFDAGPAVRYLLPDPERRRRVMTRSFASYLRYGRRFGQVDLSPAGAAIWLPDGALPVTLPKLLRCGFAPALASMGVPALRRTYRFDAVSYALHERVVRGRHLYLFILGAYPPGRGEGERLLQPGLERADRDGLPCYLETTAPRAPPFYARYGFKVAAEGDVPGGPRLWGLLRPAAGLFRRVART